MRCEQSTHVSATGCERAVLLLSLAIVRWQQSMHAMSLMACRSILWSQLSSWQKRHRWKVSGGQQGARTWQLRE